MRKSVKLALALSIAMASCGLGGTLLADGAVAASKPAAGCLLKSGARSPSGTVLGIYTCKGVKWVKTPAQKYKPWW